MTLVIDASVALTWCFDDESAALADPIAGAITSEVPGDPADQHSRIIAGGGEQPAGERGRGRLAMRAGNHDRIRIPQKLLANGFGQRRVPQPAIEHRFKFSVAP